MGQLNTNDIPPNPFVHGWNESLSPSPPRAAAPPQLSTPPVVSPLERAYGIVSQPLQPAAPPAAPSRSSSRRWPIGFILAGGVTIALLVAIASASARKESPAKTSVASLALPVRSEAAKPERVEVHESTPNLPISILPQKPHATPQTPAHREEVPSAQMSQAIVPEVTVAQPVSSPQKHEAHALQDPPHPRSSPVAVVKVPAPNPPHFTTSNRPSPTSVVEAPHQSPQRLDREQLQHCASSAPSPAPATPSAAAIRQPLSQQNISAQTPLWIYQNGQFFRVAVEPTRRTVTTLNKSAILIRSYPQTVVQKAYPSHPNIQGSPPSPPCFPVYNYYNRQSNYQVSQPRKYYPPSTYQAASSWRAVPPPNAMRYPASAQSNPRARISR